MSENKALEFFAEVQKLTEEYTSDDYPLDPMEVGGVLLGSSFEAMSLVLKSSELIEVVQDALKVFVAGIAEGNDTVH